MINLNYLNVNDLKEGDIIGFTFPVHSLNSFGRIYKYPRINKVTVDRITPKRTKFYINGVPYLEREVSTRCVVYDNNAIYIDTLAGIYSDCSHLYSELLNRKSYYGYKLFSLEKLDDEDLKKVHDLLLYLKEKYLNENGEKA